MEPEVVKLRDVKPALAGYISESMALLKSTAVHDDRVVHDVRVLMKKARSVLRLAASQMDVEFISRENKALREVGKIMSSWRDTSVLRKALKELKKEHQDIFSKLEDNEKLNDLMKKPEAVEVPSETEMNSFGLITEILKKSGYRIRFEPMKNYDPNLLLRSLQATYTSVVNNYLISRNNPKPANLHKFRMRAKDFLFQLWFFRPLNSSVVKSLEKKLDLLTLNLGKYHDLAQLIGALDYKYEYTVNSPALDELVVIIHEEQDRYLEKVWPVAHKIFCPGQNLVNILGFRLLVV
jgi:CHAD domain-containing protein